MKNILITTTLIIDDIGIINNTSDKFTANDIKKFLIQQIELDNLSSIKKNVLNMSLKEEKDIFFRKFVNGKIKKFNDKRYIFELKDMTVEKRNILFDYIQTLEKEWQEVLKFLVI